jgi:AcrB/AcrD/AcrF family
MAHRGVISRQNPIPVPPWATAESQLERDQVGWAANELVELLQAVLRLSARRLSCFHIGRPAPGSTTASTKAKTAVLLARDRRAAPVEAARLRLRPILMTSLAFIFGVVPLVWATGAGAELRQALGTAVFAGMIGVTAFGLIFTPAFYVISRWLAALGRRRTTAALTSTPAE